MKQLSELEYLDEELDTSVFHIKANHPQRGLHFFQLEKRHQFGYMPRYLVGSTNGEQPKEFRKLSDALAELVIQMSDKRARSDEYALWWTKGQGIEEFRSAWREAWSQEEPEEKEQDPC